MSRRATDPRSVLKPGRCPAAKLFDKPPKMVFLVAARMNTTFTKQMTTHTPVNGFMAICQRACPLAGIVGMKF
jgi:hypothetical protein